MIDTRQKIFDAEIQKTLERTKTKLKPGARILIAMSGGVDSSVTAALLKMQGFDVVGVHLQLWDHGASNFERTSGRCCSLIDSNDARKVCDRLDIPYFVVNAQEVFREKVVDYFIHEYLQSRTPNPCAQCNTEIKFDYLIEKAEELGCDYIATGHYAQVEHDESGGPSRLKRGVDGNKDQSYFLFGLSQESLKKTLLPLGGFSKSLVRRMAEEFELSNAKKADSQEICFIGSEGYKGFIEQRVPEALRPPGGIRIFEGEVVGRHEGLYRYTVGQRKGLNLTVKNPDQYFVLGFDTRNNELIIGPESALLRTRLRASQMNWIAPIDMVNGLHCEAKIRSRQDTSKCHIMPQPHGEVLVVFDEPQRAITPGQALVLYRGDEVIGGGFIDGTYEG